MLAVTRRPLSLLVEDIYTTYGEMHMAEYDWALTPESRAWIHDLIMVQKKIPDFGLEVDHISYLDGCKIYFKNAWIIVRFSGTEPRVRIFAENDTPEHARDLVCIMADFVHLTMPL
jgi:phosphomannomutase